MNVPKVGEMMVGERIGVLNFGIALLGMMAPGSAIAEVSLSGHCAEDFASVNAIEVRDTALPDIGMPHTLAGSISGFDLQSLVFFYDADIDQLLICFDTFGVGGDADGDGDPGGTSTELQALGGYDVPNLGGAESVAMMMDLDQDGAHDVILGVSAYGDLGDLGVYRFSGSRYAPSVAFGEALDVAIDVVHAPSPEAPDLQLIIHNFQVSLSGDGDPSFNFTASFGSFSDAGIGEDFLPSATGMEALTLRGGEVVGDGSGGVGCSVPVDGLDEICDGLDQDCDGRIDEGLGEDSDGEPHCPTPTPEPLTPTPGADPTPVEVPIYPTATPTPTPGEPAHGQPPTETPMAQTPTAGITTPFSSPTPLESGSPSPDINPSPTPFHMPTDAANPIGEESPAESPTPEGTPSPSPMATPSPSSDECGPESLWGAFDGVGPIAEVPVDGGKVSGSEAYPTPGVSGVTTVAYRAEDGALLLATGEGDDSLYRAAPGGMAFERVGGLGGGASNLQAMAFAPEAAQGWGFEPGALYGLSIDGVGACSPNCLFEINPETGAAKAIAGVQANQLRAMSFDPIDGQLLAYDAGGKRLLWLNGDGRVRRSQPVASSHQWEETGVDTLFSLAHGCDGALYGVDVAYGVLVAIDPTTGAAKWLGEYGAVTGAAPSFSLYGLDGGDCGCSGTETGEGDLEDTPTPTEAREADLPPLLRTLEGPRAGGRALQSP